MVSDPALGRFTSADSIVPPGVQGLDRYGYVNNSPVRYTDPSGHESVCGQANSDPECGDLGHSPLSHPHTSGGGGSGGNSGGNSGGSGNGSGGSGGNSGGSGNGSGGGGGDDVISDILAGIPSNREVCSFALSGSGTENMCSADYSGLLDPYNPYSIPVMLSTVPIILWEPDSVNWGDVFIDVIGIGADLYPPGQPYATSIEIAGAGLNGVNLSISTIEVDNYLHGRQPSVDKIGFALDIFSIPPEIGIYASVAGLGYDLSKGFNTYYFQINYGPPQP